MALTGLTGVAKPLQWLIDYVNGNTFSSKAISANDAIGTAPVWYAVNKIAGHVGMLPLNVHRRTADGSEKDMTHPGHSLMRIRPNLYQIPIIFRELIQTHALLWGNGRAYIVRDNRGVPVELIPLMPDRTCTVIYQGEKWHISQPRKDERLIEVESEAKPDKQVAMPDYDVLHIPGLGFDGIGGKSLLRVARESLTVGVQGDKRAANQMTKGFSAQLMLEAPEGMLRTPEQATEFLKAFRDQHAANKDAETVGLLREGMKAQVLNMSNRDAEFLASRKFQREEVALWLGIETMPGTGNDSYNSLEQRNLAYLSSCLQKWLTKWEQECDAKLLTGDQLKSGSHYFRFNVASLLRTDLQTTINSFGNAISNRIMNPNEARERLDMNAYDGGEVFENPAITPGAPGSTTQPESVPPETAQNRLEHMLGIEQKRVNNFLASGKSFERIEQWYGEWQVKLGDVVANELGGDRAIAEEHCKMSLDYLRPGRQSFDLSGTAELLAERISNAQLQSIDG